MKTAKFIFIYSFWTIIAFLFGILHMRILLGPKPEPQTGFLGIFNFVYEWALIQVGSIIGGIIAAIYLLIEYFVFRKKLTHNLRSNLIRFATIVGVSVVVGVLHYVLEEVIDVI